MAASPRVLPRPHVPLVSSLKSRNRGAGSGCVAQYIENIDQWQEPSCLAVHKLLRSSPIERFGCIFNADTVKESESMAITQLAKWGNSLAVRIPKFVAEGAQLREG